MGRERRPVKKKDGKNERIAALPPFADCLAVAAWAASAGFWACLAASLRHFRGAAAGPADLPMTLIKPVRGLDDAMEASFRSLVAADPSRVLQIVVALESADDPAYPVAKAFAAAHPDRDISVLLTGPAGGRMGKAHNMIEAYKTAKHPRVLFSDADTSITPALLADTARAFREGAGAVFGLPYHVDAPGLGGWCFMVAFNHSYCVPAALAYEAGQFRSFAGAWMGYTRETLEKAGGLEPFSHAIADDFALGMAARRSGARLELLREPVFVSESGTAPLEVFRHVAKWASIICWSFPLAWVLAPFFNPVVLGLAAVAAAALTGERWPGRPAPSPARSSRGRSSGSSRTAASAACEGRRGPTSPCWAPTWARSCSGRWACAASSNGAGAATA